MILVVDLAGAVLCALGRHRWAVSMVDRRATPPLVTEVCERRGCRGRTSRQRT